MTVRGSFGEFRKIGFGLVDFISEVGAYFRMCEEKFDCRCQTKFGQLFREK